MDNELKMIFGLIYADKELQDLIINNEIEYIDYYVIFTTIKKEKWSIEDDTKINEFFYFIKYEMPNYKKCCDILSRVDLRYELTQTDDVYDYLENILIREKINNFVK